MGLIVTRHEMVKDVGVVVDNMYEVLSRYRQVEVSVDNDIEGNKRDHTWLMTTSGCFALSGTVVNG